MDWRIIYKAVTKSTNNDALGGESGDVFVAGMQTAGRGRLDHKWLSPPNENLMMSAVVGVAGVPPHEAATLPLVAGLTVAQTVDELVSRCRKDASADVVEVSSTDLRRALKEGEAASRYLHPDVEEYIRKCHLYHT